MLRTRSFMLLGVIVLSLLLVGVAIASDSVPQNGDKLSVDKANLFVQLSKAADVATPSPVMEAPADSEIEAELQAEATYPRLAVPPGPERAAIALPGAVIFYSDFETNDGGMISTLDWIWGEYDWTGTTCDSTNYPPPDAHSGTHMWGTQLNTCYQNLGNNAGYGTCTNTAPADDSILFLTVNLTGYNNVSLSWWEWYDVFSSWDWAEVYANGTPILQHCEPSFVQPNSWVQRVVDLTPYAGNWVTLEFHLMASTVINHAGWFIDDLMITGDPVPVIAISPQSLELDMLPDQTRTLTATISNVGGADLIWSLTDTDSGWLNEDINNGTIPPGGETPVRINFDATGKIIGWYTASIDISSNDPFDPLILLPAEMNVVSGLWTQIPLPVTCPDWQRFDGEFFPDTGLVYFMGGRQGSNFFGTIYSFDPIHETCMDTGQSMPIPIANYTIALVNNGTENMLCTMGGYSNTAANTSAVQCYDPIANTVEQVSTLPADYGVFNPGGVAVVNNKVYIIGGYKSDAAPYNTAQTWEWDPVTNTWTQKGDISLGRGYINVAVVDSLIYAMGGDTFDGSNLSAQQSTEVYNPATGLWSDGAVTDLPQATGEGRAYGFDKNSLYNLHGKILIAGGGQWPERTNDVFTYDVDSDSYDYLFADLNEQRRDQAGFFIPDEDGIMWVFGGNTESDSPPHGTPEYYSVGQIPHPDIEVVPSALSSIQQPDSTTVKSFSINNLDSGDLIWKIAEQEAGALVFGLPHPNIPQVNSEVAPTSRAPIGTMALGEWLYDINAETPTADNQLLGVEFDGTYFWVTGGNKGIDPNKLYKLDKAGVLLATYDQPASCTIWGGRDLAFDGINLYYGCEDGFIHQVNPATGLPTGLTIPSPTSVARALAYDRATEHFWVADWNSNLYEISRTGEIINSFPPVGRSTYGMAWDYYSVGGPYLWLWSQDGPDPYLMASQVDPTTGLLTGVSFLGHGASGEMAGGATISDQIIADKVVFIGLNQIGPDRIGIYDLNIQCLPDNLSWLSVDLSTGTTPGNSTSLIHATLDSTGMPFGTYSGNLCITSNDPDEGSVILPVTMDVEYYHTFLPLTQKR